MSNIKFIIIFSKSAPKEFNNSDFSQDRTIQIIPQFHPASCSISSTPYILSFNPKYFSHICLLFSQTLPLTICSLKNSQGKLIDVKIKVKFLKFLKYCFSGKFFRSSSWEQDFNLLPSPVFSILLSPTLVVCYAEMTCLNVYSFGLTPVLIVFGLQEFCFILGLEQSTRMLRQLITICELNVEDLET